jgi:hypothetical protein
MRKDVILLLDSRQCCVSQARDDRFSGTLAMPEGGKLPC